MDSLFYGRSRHAPYYPGGGYGVGRVPVLELLVPMCCAKCEEKIYEEMMELRGVQGVMVDRQAQRVIVHGFVDPHKALKKAKKVKRDSQIWSGEQYGRDWFSSPKYRRSAYRSPSIYRTPSLEYRPSSSLYRTSSYEHRYPSNSVYRSSYNRYTPSYGRAAYQPHAWPVYDDMYSDVVTNPYYLKHIESEYY